MTRESIPRFDLYAELEVPRDAAPAAIEAAHRAMAKQHHPDVALAGAANADWAGKALAVAQAEERIKRINVARDWLLDPERRERYDRALRRREGGAAATGDFEAGPGRAAWTSFGPNAERVRVFLAELRDIDERRGMEILDGKRSIDPDDYAHARRAAFAISRSRRLSEWLFSRDAAAGVVREFLGEGRLGNEVADTVAEIAGAIAVRDLIPAPLFDTLLEPWVWRGRQVAARATRPPITMTTAPRTTGLGGRPIVARAATPPPAPVATSPAAVAAPRVREPGPARKPRPPREPLKLPQFRAPQLKAPQLKAPQLHAPRAALPILAASSAGLLVVATLLGASALFHPFTGGIAGIEASGGNQSLLPGGAASAAPTPQGPGATQEPAPTPQGSQPPATLDPAVLAAMQDRVEYTLGELQYYQARGLVKSAQKLLGDSATGLQSSGLSHATFPDPAAPTDIQITGATGAWTATVPSPTGSTDTLTSADGIHWALDYGARPIAFFGKSSTHDLFWTGGTANSHDIFVRILSTIVTTNSISLNVTWHYGPDSAFGTDAHFFEGTTLNVAGITVGGVPIEGATGEISNLGTDVSTAKVKLPATIDVSGLTVLQIQVVNGGSFRGFDSIDAEIVLPR